MVKIPDLPICSPTSHTLRLAAAVSPFPISSSFRAGRPRHGSGREDGWSSRPAREPPPPARALETGPSTGCSAFTAMGVVFFTEHVCMYDLNKNIGFPRLLPQVVKPQCPFHFLFDSFHVSLPCANQGAWICLSSLAG